MVYQSYKRDAANIILESCAYKKWRPYQNFGATPQGKECRVGAQSSPDYQIQDRTE